CGAAADACGRAGVDASAGVGREAARDLGPSCRHRINPCPTGRAGARMTMQRAFTPLRLAGLELRNRVIKTATFEGMSPGGVPSPALIEHHAAIARGGVGMTTLAYVAVSPHGRTFGEQLVMSDALVDQLRPLTEAVHRE